MLFRSSVLSNSHITQTVSLLTPYLLQYQTTAKPASNSSPSSPLWPMASLAKLTSQSTQTLSLLLERQRLSTLSSGSNTLHSTQITRNLNQLRNGILDLEEKEGPSEAVRLLKSQFERMRGMLGEEADIAGVQRFVHLLWCSSYHWNLRLMTSTIFGYNHATAATSVRRDRKSVV